MSTGQVTTFHVPDPPTGAKYNGVLFTFSHETELTDGRFSGQSSVLKGTALLFRFDPKAKLPRQVSVFHRGMDAALLMTNWLTSTSAASIEKLMAQVASPESVFAERRRRLDKLGKPLRDPALAMCTLDELTDPAELERRGNTEAAADIRVLTQYLMFRVLQRASWALCYREFEPPVRLDEQYRHRGLAVERLFRKALIKAFPRPGACHQLDLHAFQETFARFVCGELALGRLAPLAKGKPDPLVYHGVPDGVRFLCFAEAALYFLRLGIAEEFWLVALRTFACTAAVFTSCFWDGRRRTVDGYEWSHLHDCPPSASVLATLKQRYWAMSLPEIAEDFAKTVACALGDDLSVTRPVPTPLELR